MENPQEQAESQLDNLKNVTTDKSEGFADIASDKIKEMTGIDVSAKADEFATAATEKLEEAKEVASGLWGKVKGVFGA